MKKLLTFLFILAFSSISFAQISFSGDMQVRPRFDIKNWNDYGNKGVGKTEDMYYMLRARVNINAKVGGGWYAKTQLAHYNYANYAFTNGLASYAPLLSDDDLMARPTVNFTEMYLGYKSKAWGFQAGVVTESGLKNPLLDLHFHPYKIIDIPWTINHDASFYGGKLNIAAGPGNINFMAALRVNNSLKEDVQGSTIGNDYHDVYAFGLNYSFKVADFWFQPALLLDWASDSLQAPISYGLNFATPKFSGWQFGATAAFTSNSVDGTAQYDGSLIRVKATGKLGPGALIAWYDFDKRTDNFTSGDIDHDYTYLWLAYKFTIAKYDNGAAIVMPRWRHMTEKVDNAKDYSRDKIECLFIVTFK